MPEYVYALHDFLPEHEDEITFLAGQPIEVIERDDQYNDGWWQGRNVTGKIGLFPQSYTTLAAPSTVTSTSSSPSSPGVPLTMPPDSSEPLGEGPDSNSFHGSDDESRIGIAIGDPDHTQGEVMKATMTDVQQAIEQLGWNDRDGAQSFSFASTQGGDTDRDTDGTETDGEIGEGWHRSARDKLAEEARKVVEAKAAAAAENTHVRTSAPPIDVEMSDDSEAEEDDSALQHLQHVHFTRDHPHIPEEDESEEARRNSVAWNHRRKESNETSSAILPREDLPSPVEDSGERTATANQTSFTSTSSPPRSTRSPNSDEDRSPQLLPTSSSPNTRSIVAPAPIVLVDATMVPTPVSPNSIVQATPTHSVVREVHTSLPSPALTAPNTQRNSQQASKHNSVSSTGKASTGSVQSPPEMELLKKSTPPSEWSVEEVVDWLKSKGFGSDVYEKFIEQEITGDVLLELDINLLKVEIGIIAFGKRMRIANAIAELRRPPSIIFTDHQPQHSQSQSISHSISQSFTYPYSPSASTQQSLNSPMFVTGMGAVMNRPGSASFGGAGGPESPRPETVASPILPKRVSSLSSTGASLNGGVEETGVAAGIEKAMMVGMVGLGLGALPPGQLAPSPSDSALNKQPKTEPEESSERVDDDRGALSENESVPSTSKQRRRLFGYSVESSSSGKDKNKSGSINTSKDALAPSPASGTASPRPIKRESQDDSSVASRHSRGKRKNEVTNKGPERLSLFGGTFSTSIGRSRKPPPRITSALLEESAPSEKTSTLSLSRLYGRRVSGRPSTSDGTAVSSLRTGLRANGDAENKEREKARSFDKPKDEEKDASKATNFSPREPRANPMQGHSPSQDGLLNGRGPNSLKPKKNIIDQIGQPDHEGWMRKKGDHYNSWKVRYFIIKGPHLYILRSNNKAEAKIKGYVNIVGYKVVADENIDPGRYGFRIVHETDKTHYFSSDEQAVVREWMKAIMKATIGRDYSKPVVSSVNIPTIPLTVAQAMNPAPRPPSPTARAATQKALRRENPDQLSTRDARVLMGLPSPNNAAHTEDPQENERSRLESFFASQPVSAETGEIGHGWAVPKTKNAPPRPSREARRGSLPMNEMQSTDSGLVDWANSHLPRSLQVNDPAGPLFGGLALLRLAEDMMGKPASPPIPDTAFPSGPNDDKLDGLFRLFDFLLDNDVKMGSVSINDVRQGKREKVMQLVKALKTWEDRRREIVKSIGRGSVQAGPFATWR
ncbi:hypothetical protein PAXRUDRAFT_827121 [Paxillus rubicundulus Ve08.2h10]|uniref:Uncharacterized protein n=1 Tax=Paxillus rubicundulus Ve08.2h10 TaxID=930991 RepID=A0A0D0E8Y2_9AGAM|nr:hypothetical protein PAXRUDRAFT_827121 [Paxillus rubicundulus Ve08.2h10]